MLQAQPERVGRRVLVVEDDADIRELIKTRLRLAGFAVTTARDGVEALELLQTLSPAAMVLDLNMPRLDGFGVLSALQLNPFARDGVDCAQRAR